MGNQRFGYAAPDMTPLLTMPSLIGDRLATVHRTIGNATPSLGNLVLQNKYEFRTPSSNHSKLMEQSPTSPPILVREPINLLTMMPLDIEDVPEAGNYSNEWWQTPSLENKVPWFPISPYCYSSQGTISVKRNHKLPCVTIQPISRRYELDDVLSLVSTNCISGRRNDHIGHQRINQYLGAYVNQVPSVLFDEKENICYPPVRDRVDHVPIKHNIDSSLLIPNLTDDGSEIFGNEEGNSMRDEFRNNLPSFFLQPKQPTVRVTNNLPFE